MNGSIVADDVVGVHDLFSVKHIHTGSKITRYATQIENFDWMHLS